MTETRFDLKLVSGRVVTWPGTDADDAIRRYLDGHRDEAVVAWRLASVERFGIFQWGRGNRIVE